MSDHPTAFTESNNFWKPVPGALDTRGQQLFTCTLCDNKKLHAKYYEAEHNQGLTHQGYLAELISRRDHPDEDNSSLLASYDSQRRLVDDALHQLLASLKGDSKLPPAPQTPSPEPAITQGINFHLFEATEDTNLDVGWEREVARTVAQELYDHYESFGLDEDDERYSEDEEDERGVGDVEEGAPVPEPRITFDDGLGTPSLSSTIRKRIAPEDEKAIRRHWFPWHNKMTCTLDVLMHLPRSVFSQRQLDLFLWLLKVNGVEDVPSVRSMLGLNAALQRACGIDSVAYKGALGHTYYVNALDQIIAQEMSNPRVRPHLHFYPEDTGGKVLAEARQAERWLKDAPDDVLTPMLRLRGQDYYIYEPLMLKNGAVCMPVRWFNRVIDGERVWFAKYWRMESAWIDGVYSWRVVKEDDLDIGVDDFLMTFPELQDAVGRYAHLPHPSRIYEIRDVKAKTVNSWTLTNPVLGNPWRERSKGHRVLSVPLWVYCDDTSGNLSKKWNEHNSVLFTLAGLPREHVQKEYNIHFLTTSNTAPPLEMLDGVVEQLESAQHEGVWAWDSFNDAPVLLVPFVLALLGDNPMQSEFACHMGMRAKLFCRNCWAKGRDATDDGGKPGKGRAAPEQDIDSVGPVFDGDRSDDEHTSVVDETGSVSSAGDGSGREDDGSEVQGIDGKRGKTRAKKAMESMAEMLARVKTFIKTGEPRNKAETANKLRTYFELASKPEGKSTIAKMRTASGIKDTLHHVFLEKLFTAAKHERGYAAKQAAIDAALQALPENITNPIWRIKELDAHQDTPVEVLHVVLLGFVKYMWRDLVQNQVKTNDAKKDLLATRLSSLDVSGLGLAPLVGKTLVQYAGSLTGRDFRAIAQVAPFVVYDLVSPDCYETWVALSKLIPLIWQPCIYGVKDYLDLLKREIEYFLLCVGRWTVRWFNKPKFHIILHLVDHIRRFGPAALFATEAFESFNAVIRAKSVHSNRQAPSRDIARAFAQGNRIRHLLSGGYFMYFEPASTPTNNDVPGPEVQGPVKFSFQRSDWKSVGGGPRSLVADQSTVSDYLGLAGNDDHPGRKGECMFLHPGPASFTSTKTAQVYPHLVPQYTPYQFKSARMVVLQNGDDCKLNSFAIIKKPQSATDTCVARVTEILTVKGSQQDLQKTADMVLVQIADVSEATQPYRMPRIQMESGYYLLALKDILCTVNVQHNCAVHHCTISGSRAIRQERQLTGGMEARTEHKGVSDDLVLNTAQMRDARYVQRFRIDSPSLKVDDILLPAVAREVDARKLPPQATRGGRNLRGRALVVRGIASRGQRVAGSPAAPE